jgi:aquaporin NIP
MSLSWRRPGAEFVGTFVVVLASCGAVIVNSRTGALGHVGVALAPGLAVMVMIAAAGHISGAHFNPAVTLAFALTRHFDWREVPGYWLGQFSGAISAAAILWLLFGRVASLGANRPAGSALQALGLEVLLTAALMFVITAVATDTRAEGASAVLAGQMAAVAIGGTVALNSLWAGPISGASMNPARSFGPALVAGAWDAHWVYWLGPLLGAVIGAALYQALRAQPLAGAARHEQIADVEVHDEAVKAG